MDTGGWYLFKLYLVLIIFININIRYDLDTKEFKNLQDIIFITAMLPSGTQVSMRYLRHF